MMQGVAEQIAQNLFQTLGVRPDEGQCGRHLSKKSQALFLGLRLEGPYQAIDQLV